MRPTVKYYLYIDSVRNCAPESIALVISYRFAAVMDILWRKRIVRYPMRKL